MNFLGHLYFSGDDKDLMIANLFGDFVKGIDYTYLPLKVQDGVKLHREIDDFIDHHPLITDLRSKLYKELPKIAGIAIDLYMDHLLAKNWSKYSKTSLEDFVQDFFEYAFNKGIKNYKYPIEFIELLHLIHERDWIIRYKSMEGLTMASTGLSKRVSFENNLYEAPRIYLKMEQEISDVFYKYMIDAMERFDHTI